MRVLSILKRYYWRNLAVARLLNFIRNIFIWFNSTTTNNLYIENVKKIKRSNYYRDIVIDNDFYGHKYELKNTFQFNNTTYIEHGLYFGRYFQDKLRNSFVDSVICMSEFRLGVNTSNSIKARAIGPYIAYVEASKRRIISDKYSLVFVSHTGKKKSREIEHIRSISEWSSNVKRVSSNRLVFLLHPNDLDLSPVLDGVATSCGLQDDRLFLKRLKSLIHHAEDVVVDGIGTHIGYCVYLNKKLVRVPALRRQFVKVVDNSSKLENRFQSDSLRLSQLNLIEDALPLWQIVDASDNDLWQICSELWGFDHIIAENK